MVLILSTFFAEEASSQCTPLSFGACANPYETIITRVTVNSSQYSTGCTGAYTFYGNVGHSALAGAPNTLTVRTRFNGSWAANGQGWVYAWIDYNSNGVYEVSERIMFQSGTQDAESDITTNFTPPATVNGTRTMLIRTQYYQDTYISDTDPCYYTYGESEAYTISITPPTPDPSPVAIVLANPGSSTSINPPVGAGTYDIGFILQNVSGGALASVTANYTITGPQNRSGSVNWSGNLAVGGTVYVPLASNLALSDPLQPYTVSINLTNSVGSQGPGDGNLANNSLTGFVAMALNGSADPLNPNIYYVSGAPVPGQWFANLTDVAAALTFGGILGAVEFRVRPGTYNEQMLIGQISQTVQGIPGSSPSRPVTFTADAAAGGNVNNVIVSSANTSLNNHTVQLNGADNITFRNMTFAINTASAVAGRNFWLRNGTDNVTISNCRFQGRSAIIGGANDALIFSETTNAPTNLTISNNTFTNGDIGVMIDGGVSGNPISNLVISNNTLNGFFTQGIYVRRATAPRVTNNQVNGSTVNPSGAFGLNLEGLVNDAVIARNRIAMTTLGTGIRFNTNTALPALPASIANNMINVGNGVSSVAMGISVVSATNTNVFHNTVNVNAPASATAAAFNISSSLPTGLRVVNNIFYNRGLGYAYYIAVSGFPTQSDWNNLFTAGANLGWHTSANRTNLAAFRSGTFELNTRSVPLTFTGPLSTFLTEPNTQLRGINSYNNTAVGNVSDDINTTARMAPPYMGAHELVPVVTFASGPIDSTCTGGDITLRSRPIIRSNIDGVQTTIYDAASGTPAPSWVSFRWSKGGSPLFDQPGKISGTRTMDLTIARTNFFDGDNYSMLATIKDGSAFRDNPVDTLFYPYSVTVKVNEPVSISRHPLSQVVCRAGVVNLNVIASQGTIWGYQWYKDGQPLVDGNNIYNAQRVEGSKTVNLVLTGVDYQVAGRYMCMLTTSCGASLVPTEEAIVYIARPTQIATAPSNQVVGNGGTARFEVKVAEITEGPNVAPVKYMWYRGTTQLKDSPRISGANSSVLTIRNVGTADVASNYYVKVIGACGADSSGSFGLSIGSITINTQPSSSDVCEGQEGTLSIDATPNGAQGLSLGYQWRKGTEVLVEGGRYSGTQSNTLKISGVMMSDMGNYNCVVSLNPGAIVSVVSNDAVLTVKEGVRIIAQPQSAVICEGAEATMSVSATGAGSLSYQWQLNGNDIVGATDSMLKVAAVSGTDQGNYRVVVTGDCGSVSSSVAMLRMKTKPVVYGPTENKLSIKAGGYLRLAVATASDPTTKYQWYRGSTAITSDSISNAIYSKFGVAVGTDAGKYYCRVSNDCGSTNSDTTDVTVTTEVSSVEEENANGLYLSSNDPNPFDGVTTIRFNVPQSGTARLVVSDNFGREVAVLYDGVAYGLVPVSFDGGIYNLSAGVYNYTLTANGQSLTRRMIYVK
jgi:hypothetical protein